MYGCKAQVVPFTTVTTMRQAFDKAGYRTKRTSRAGIRTNKKGWFIKRRK
jgi:hypothetical protein